MVKEVLVPVIIMIFSLFNFSLAQESKLVFEKPERLSDNINSSGEEIIPLLSITGDTLFFARAVYDKNTGGKYAGMDIWYSTRDPATGDWEPASNDLPAGWNDKWNNAIIGTSNDGKVIYFNSSSNPEKGILFSKWYHNKWTKPELIPIYGLVTESFHGFYMSADYSKLIISMNGNDSYGEEDLYISIKDTNGVWQKPVNLGSTINSSGYEISPYLAEDNYLFFSSDGLGGYGNADIFFSQRLYGSWDVWTKPVNLGKEINSPRFDAYFALYGDTLCFFTSNKQGGLADIYTAKATFNKNNATPSTLITKKQILSDKEIMQVFGFDFKRILLFDKDSDQLDNIARETLWFINDKLSEKKDIYVGVIGYADVDGEENHNFNLSSRRANNVRNYLISLGFDNWRISVESFGEERALYQQDPQKQFDRKVELFFYRLQ